MSLLIPMSDGDDSESGPKAALLELHPIGLGRAIPVAAVSPIVARLQEQLAEKDAEVAELKSELRAARYAAAFGGEIYEPPMTAQWFSEN